MGAFSQGVSQYINGGACFNFGFRHKLLSASVLAVLTLAVLPAQACTPTTVLAPVQNVVVGAQTIKNPLGAGVRIGSFMGSSSYLSVFGGCGNGEWATTWGRSTQSPVSTWNGYGVYPTGVEGIGYAISMADGKISEFVKLTTNETGTGNRFFAASFSTSLGARTNVYFVTTAPLKGGVYNIPAQNIAIMRSRDWSATSIDGTPSGTSNVYLTPFTLTVKTPTCDLSAGDTNRTVILDTIKPFTGNVAGKKSFEITANCTDASNVTFKFTGTPSATDAWRFKNTGTSTGVNLTFYDRLNGAEKTITANNDSNTRTVSVSDGKAVLPVGAAYFNNGKGTSTTGTVASTVTVNISYN